MLVQTSRAFQELEVKDREGVHQPDDGTALAGAGKSVGFDETALLENLQRFREHARAADLECGAEFKPGHAGLASLVERLDDSTVDITPAEER